jgi:hypothetical protein
MAGLLDRIREIADAGVENGTVHGPGPKIVPDMPYESVTCHLLMDVNKRRRKVGMCAEAMSKPATTSRESNQPRNKN